MIKKLLKRYQEWRDRRFLKRLERVMNNNILNVNLNVRGFTSAYGQELRGYDHDA